MAATGSNEPRTTKTIKEVIFHSAIFLKKEVTIEGTVTILDRDLGRMDVARDGAKLIVRIASLQDEVSVGDDVVVTGILRKEQRRTFLEASQVRKEMFGTSP